jgi:hypothetical protein
MLKAFRVHVNAMKLISDFQLFSFSVCQLSTINDGTPSRHGAAAFRKFWIEPNDANTQVALAITAMLSADSR